MIRLALSLIALGALSTLPIEAKDLTDSKCGCQMSIPDNWTVSYPKAPPGSYVATASNPDRTQMVCVYIAANSGTQQGHEDYIRGFEQTVADHHATITSRENKKVGDVDFQVLTVPIPVGAGVMNNTAWFAFSGKQAFQVGLYSKVVDSAKDPDLLAIVRSFKLTAPQPQ